MNEMNDINQKLLKLSGYSKQIHLYDADIKNALKGAGRIVGKFDTELLEFLKFTNGASVFDYCFMGFKNSKLGVDIDKCALELWASNKFLAGRFLPFMITSTSDNFGYLIDLYNDKGCHPVAYYSNIYEGVHVIGSSFKNFMDTFLIDVEDTLNGSKENMIININKPDWPVDINHWLAKDKSLRENRNRIHQTMKQFMPDTDFY